MDWIGNQRTEKGSNLVQKVVVHVLLLEVVPLWWERLLRNLTLAQMCPPLNLQYDRKQLNNQCFFFSKFENKQHSRSLNKVSENLQFVHCICICGRNKTLKNCCSPWKMTKHTPGLVNQNNEQFGAKSSFAKDLVLWDTKICLEDDKHLIVCWREQCWRSFCATVSTTQSGDKKTSKNEDGFCDNLSGVIF